MTKKDIGLMVSKKLVFKEKDGIYVVNRILEGIKEILKEEGRIEIRGLGSFAVVQRKDRKGRVIKTGKLVNIPSYKTIVFTPGEAIKRLEDRGES